MIDKKRLEYFTKIKITDSVDLKYGENRIRKSLKGFKMPSSMLRVLNHPSDLSFSRRIKCRNITFAFKEATCNANILKKKRFVSIKSILSEL